MHFNGYAILKCLKGTFQKYFAKWVEGAFNSNTYIRIEHFKRVFKSFHQKILNLDL